MTAAERDSCGSEYEIGNTCGFDRTLWVVAVASIASGIGRDLSARERFQFARGYLDGRRDRVEWGEELIQRARAELADEIPF
ncbi:MAG: hypothetical protein ACKODX_01075 [Gemmata sp.]